MTDLGGIRPSFPQASQTKSSISLQASQRATSVQMSAISFLEYREITWRLYLKRSVENQWLFGRSIELRIQQNHNNNVQMGRKLVMGFLCLLSFFFFAGMAFGFENPETDEEKQRTIEKQLQENLGTEGRLEAEAFRIRMTSQITMNYVFNDSPDSFLITYRLELSEPVHNKADVLKGSAKIGVSIKGFLAKWPSGECTLNISASEAPYEIIYNRHQEENAKINIRFTGTILEQWQSNCQFKDQAGSKFTTTGNPEKWLDRALKVAAREFTDMTLPVDRYHKQSHKQDFELKRFILADPPLGSAEIEGSGTVELMPE